MCVWPLIFLNVQAVNSPLYKREQKKKRKKKAGIYIYTTLANEKSF